jgi:hypothetical protein
MLLAYLDEAGIGNIKNEPIVAVAGVIVQSVQWKATEARINQLIAKYIPRENQGHFIFHAHEMFHGTGKIWGNRAAFTPEIRRQALEELLSVPATIGFPVLHASVKAEQVLDDHPLIPRKNGKIVKNGKVVAMHAIAASLCMLMVEKVARDFAKGGDLAIVIHENNDQSRKLVRDVHNFMRKPGMAELARDVPDRNLWKVFPVQRVIDAAHFAEKQEAPLLQLADACAFVIKRRLSGHKDVDPFLEKIASQMVTNPKGAWPLEGLAKHE